MQISISNIDVFISKINDYVIFIITFLKNIFNNIIAIRNVDFSLLNIPNSIGIILHFILSIFYILISITILYFMGSIFSIFKFIIKWTIYKPIKFLILLIYWFLLLLKYLFTPKSESKQPVETNNSNLDELKQLNKKISDLEYKLNLQKKQNIIKKSGFRYEKNKSNKKKIILILWGFLFVIAVTVLLSMLLLSLQSKQSQQSFNQPVEAKPIQSSAQQEQETYNAILKKIESEVNELTNIKEIVYHPDGKTIKHIKILDSTTKKEIKRIVYYDDGKTINWIKEYNPQTSLLIKNTVHDKQGKIKNIVKYNSLREYVFEEYNPQTGIKIGETYYNPDGTVKEVKTY
uniref:DUF2963 domain-containing protein n=1 Tax=Periwinkle leaf yellowing phytoplasma TaxID=619518 RepID=F2X4V2_9MOLU|nr:DUF2963 domain-containing protein [Periwinkle leaf yellowing phytoplasma]AEA36706.1 hypothetical protein [Periwinkle leaf yellowing phytoplasma]